MVSKLHLPLLLSFSIGLITNKENNCLLPNVNKKPVGKGFCKSSSIVTTYERLTYNENNEAISAAGVMDKFTTAPKWSTSSTYKIIYATIAAR